MSYVGRYSPYNGTAPYQNSWEMRGNGNAATPQRRDTNHSQPNGAALYPKGEGKMAGVSTNYQLFKGSLVLVVLVIVVQQRRKSRDCQEVGDGIELSPAGGVRSRCRAHFPQICW
ncbi:hypothetical protein DFP73DRAFT_531481 [Morchella snyderi]|nr:hypothetical protein DFP73DRAFT_531481 [Morchella snyderi]